MTSGRMSPCRSPVKQTRGSTSVRSIPHEPCLRGAALLRQRRLHGADNPIACHRATVPSCPPKENMKTNPEKNPASAFNATSPIVCGTELSFRDDVSLEVSAALARRFSAPLVLAHAVELPRAVLRDAEVFRWIMARRKRSVHRVAAHLRGKKFPVGERVDLGRPAVFLAETAAAEPARLIVVGSLRHHRWERWLGTGVARLTTARAMTPTLVLRETKRLLAWLRGERPLKVFACFAGTTACTGALRWIRQLADAGPLDVVLGSVGRSDAVARLHELSGGIPVRHRVVSRTKRVGARLLDMAAEEGADLIVVGATRPRGWKRMLHRSVAAGLVRRSDVSVVVVPELITENFPVVLGVRMLEPEVASFVRPEAVAAPAWGNADRPFAHPSLVRERRGGPVGDVIDGV